MKTALKISMSILGLTLGLNTQAKDIQPSNSLPNEYQGRWYLNKDRSDEGMGFGKDGWGYDTTGCAYLEIKQIAKGKLKIRTACGPEEIPTKSEIKHIATLKDGAHKSKWKGELSNINIDYLTLTLRGKTLIVEGGAVPASEKLIFKYKD